MLPTLQPLIYKRESVLICIRVDISYVQGVSNERKAKIKIVFNTYFSVVFKLRVIK